MRHDSAPVGPAADERRSTLPTVVRPPWSRRSGWATAAACGVWAIVLLVRPSNTTSGVARLVGVGLVLLAVGFALRSITGRRPLLDRSLLDRVDAAVWFAVGVAAVVWPDPTVLGLVRLCGVALVVTGAIEVVGAVGTAVDRRVVAFLGGLTSLALGIAALAWPSATTLVLSVVVAMRLLVMAFGLAAHLVATTRPTDDSATARPGLLRRSVRPTIGLIGLVVAVAAAAVAVAVHRAQPGDLDAFYDSPADLPDAPGVLVRSDVVDGAVPGATTYRVLYTTSATDGTATTSSGLVIVPDGAAPAGGRPVLAFTHGTVGIARRCALSAIPGYAAKIPGVDEFLDAGFVVAATDYPGLGSEATTAYLVGSAQAYATLDAVRVAVAMPEVAAAPRFVSFGESQGGHASLFTGQEAARYAPELAIDGVAAAAPATDLTELFRANLGTTFGGVLASYALASWRDVYGIDLADIADPQAIPVIDRLAELCLQNQQQMLSVLPEAELLKIRFLDRLPWETEPWATILDENTPGGSVVDAPVFVAQGADDPLVVPTVQQSFVDGWCERGQAIEYRVYEGVGHLDAGHASAADVATWAAARVAGDPWTPTC